MRVLKAPKLRRGDVIGLIAPASAPMPPDKIDRSVCYIERLGYRVKVGAHVKAVHGHLAGTDAQRVADLNAMLGDPQVKAIFAVRGGYGTPRLLPFIDYAAVRRSPKIIVGYSDITALQLALFRKTGLITFSGPMPAVEFCHTPDAFTEEHFWATISSARSRTVLANPSGDSARTRRRGCAEGRLLGGNLSLIVANLGTPFSPAYRGSILFVEEIAEEPYRFDRMFAQLRNAGVLRDLSGLALGHFTDCNPADRKKPHLTADEVIQEVIGWTNVPVIDQFQYGHVARKLTIPIGARARLDANRGLVALLESGVE